MVTSCSVMPIIRICCHTSPHFMCPNWVCGFPITLWFIDVLVCCDMFCLFPCLQLLLVYVHLEECGSPQ